jgi:seryl-tRNA synthetase
MLDIKLIRQDADTAKQRLARKAIDPADIDAILKLDDERREITKQVDDLKQQRNEKSKAIGKLMKEGGDAEAAKAEVRTLGDTIKELDEKLKELETDQHAKLLWLPNYPHAEAPDGGEENNKTIDTWGEKPTYEGFEPQPHKELGEALGIFDFERAAKLSGSGFSLMFGQGAALQRGLIRWLLHTHTTEHGYTEVAPPYLVTRPVLQGTGQLPKMEEDMYNTAQGDDDLFLIPTAEVPVTNLLAGEVRNADDLPLYLAAFTPCFRREAGSYGKDTTGLQRMHQFDKVELVKFVTPESSADEHEKLRANAEACLQKLGLHYRVLELATNDLSFAASRCYDLEVWAPGTGRYLEVSSCSNFEDFQARRANIRYRPEPKAKPEFVHTLNASGLALPRLMIALLETYQQADGTVELPEILHSFVGFDKITPKKVL